MEQRHGRPGTVVYGVQGPKGENGRKLSRPLLRRAALLWWGWTELPPIEKSPRGKPFFPEPAAGCHFNISHSGEYTLVALSDSLVGVDIEVIRDRGERVIRYCLSESEMAATDGSWEDFFRLWTLKEAYVKLGDTPLYPPKDVPAPPPCPYCSYSGQGWRAAVCCSGEPPAEIIWLPYADVAEECMTPEADNRKPEGK